MVRSTPISSCPLLSFPLLSRDHLLSPFLSSPLLSSPLLFSLPSLPLPCPGVAGFPQCNPSGKLLGPVCRALSAIIGDLAYNPLVQGILFQADYFRHPAHVNSTWYKKYSQLAHLNNEGDKVTAEYKTNFAKVAQLTMVKAKGDTMVFPNDGEWWGLYEKDMKTIDQMKDTSLYKVSSEQ